MIMGPLEATNSVISRYFQFSGRASRSEFWWFAGVDVLLRVVFLALDIYFIYLRLNSATTLMEILSSIQPLSMFFVWYSILVFIPKLAVTVRRLHDGGFSGRWAILLFFNAVCSILQAVLSVIYETLNVHFPDEAVAVQLWLNLFSIASMISLLILFVLLVWPSEHGENRYGIEPRAGGKGLRKSGKGGGIDMRDPLAGYALLMHNEREVSPEVIAAREAVRKEEVRRLYEERILGQRSQA